MNRASATNVGVTIKDATLLSNVSVTAAPGEWISVIGPNGAGKSTLLRVLAGALPHTGSVAVDGVDLATLSSRDRAKLVSWVPQSPTVPAGVGVLDYVLLGRTPHLHPLASPKSGDVDLAHDTLAMLDLTRLAGRRVDTLSGGELQRVAIGRALVQQATLMLLDEPTSALDLGHQQEVLMLLDQLRADSDLTIISTMHDLTLAGHFADRVLLLSHGLVAAVGPAAKVLTEANIAEHYGAKVIIRNVQGTVVISPRIASPSSFELPEHFHQQTREHEPDHPSQKETNNMSDNIVDPPTDNPAKDKSAVAKSLVVVNTGDGKGKSSAAFGVMIRGLARDWNVAVVQFVKSGEWNVGEEKIGRQLGVDWFNEGQGFTWNSDDLENDKAIAQQGWNQARDLIMGGEHQLVILDELTYLLNWGWIDPEPVYDTIRNRPEKVSLVITGRDAPQGLIDVADTVSEVVKVKHAFDSGIIAKKGIDY